MKPLAKKQFLKCSLFGEIDIEVAHFLPPPEARIFTLFSTLAGLHLFPIFWLYQESIL